MTTLATFTVLLVLSGSICCRPIVAAATPPERPEGSTTELSGRIDSDGSVRSRASVTIPTSFGVLQGFVRQRIVGGTIEVPVFGVSSPLVDLGPLREGGLQRELARPLTLGSIREASGAVVDRSAEVMRTLGGAIRIPATESGAAKLELYGLRRGGLAPPGTVCGGITLSERLTPEIGFDVAAKVTALGERNEDAWFAEYPGVRPPAITHAGARVTAHSSGWMGVLSGGVALCDRLTASGFCSGSLGYARTFRLGSRTPLAFSARLDGGVADPRYLGADGRFVPETALLHPTLSMRLPGLSLQAAYDYAVYRLPLLPVINRRTVHGGTVNWLVEFGLIEVGGFYRSRLEYSEEGRILLRETSGLSGTLSVSLFSIRGEVGLRHANVASDEAEANLCLAAKRRWGGGDLRLSVDRRSCFLEANLLVAGRLGGLNLNLVTGNLRGGDLDGRTLPGGTLIARLFSGGRISLAWHLRSR